MGLPTARVNARSGRVCMFVCANVHAPFLSKAPYTFSLKTGYWLPNTSDELVRPREPIGQP